MKDLAAADGAPVPVMNVVSATGGDGDAQLKKSVTKKSSSRDNKKKAGGLALPDGAVDVDDISDVGSDMGSDTDGDGKKSKSRSRLISCKSKKSRT